MVDKYTPKVNVAKELYEISKDFTNPRELIRETIANSLDASASKIIIDAFKDDSSGEDELVIRISDDGVGMTRIELEGFFDLGYSRKRKDGAIGHKGHGTKITYNSTLVTVFTKSIDGGTVIKATLGLPRKALNQAAKQNGSPPEVTFEELMDLGPFSDNTTSGTVIEIRGYDNNNWNAFAHDPLRDYIQWFTAWGCIATAWGQKLEAPCTLELKGIGSDTKETIEYGHPFPEENYTFRDLRKKDERRPENYFVRRWISEPIKVLRFPMHELHIVFSVEGDSAKGLRKNNLYNLTLVC
jgi:hypothetical protein